jgi:hypothetical protein
MSRFVAEKLDADRRGAVVLERNAGAYCFPPRRPPERSLHSQGLASEKQAVIELAVVFSFCCGVYIGWNMARESLK